MTPVKPAIAPRCQPPDEGIQMSGPLSDVTIPDNTGFTYLIRINVVVVDLIQRPNLLARETTCLSLVRHIRIAHKLFRQESATLRIRNNGINKTILTITLPQHLSANRRKQRGGNMMSCRCRQVVQTRLDGPRLQMTRPPRRGSRQDPVEVLGVHLDFFQTLSSSRGATRIIIEARFGAVVRLDDLLGKDDGSVHGSVAPVGEFLLVQRPGSIDGGRVVASVR